MRIGRLPDAIADELRHAFALVRSAPGAGGRATNARLNGVRRVYLSRVRYHLYYRVDRTDEVVEVLALWHASRGDPPDL